MRQRSKTDYLITNNMKEKIIIGLLSAAVMLLGVIAWENAGPDYRWSNDVDFEVATIEIDGQEYYLLDSGEIIKKSE